LTKESVDQHYGKEEEEAEEKDKMPVTKRNSSKIAGAQIKVAVSGPTVRNSRRRLSVAGSRPAD
jgi:hypothetical protein